MTNKKLKKKIRTFWLSDLLGFDGKGHVVGHLFNKRGTIRLEPLQHVKVREDKGARDLCRVLEHGVLDAEHVDVVELLLQR